MRTSIWTIIGFTCLAIFSISAEIYSVNRFDSGIERETREISGILKIASYNYLTGELVCVIYANNNSIELKFNTDSSMFHILSSAIDRYVTISSCHKIIKVSV